MVNKGKHTVLVIDDVEEMIALLIDDISRTIPGLVFETAHDTGQAIKKYDECRPGIVLLDLGLGLGSGFDVLRYIRKYNTETKVIVVSNFIDSFFRLKCADLGADHFLDKSKEFEKLPELIKSILDQIEVKVQ